MKMMGRTPDRGTDARGEILAFARKFLDGRVLMTPQIRCVTLMCDQP